MNKKLPYEVAVSEVQLLPVCWIFENNSYRYTGKSLPTIPIEYIPALKELDIPYSIKGDFCQFWDPEYYDEYIITAPLYVKIGDVYRYQKSYTAMGPSPKSIKLAERIVNIVNYEIKQMKLYQLINHFLSKEEIAKAFCVNDDNNDFEDLDLSVGTEVHFNEEYFLILPVRHLAQAHGNIWCREDKNTPIGYTKKYTGWNIAVNMDRLPCSPDLEITIPIEKKGLFIGKGGWQVREFSEAIMGRRISFVEEN